MSDEPIREYQSAVRELFKVRADGPALHERDIRRDWQALEAFNRLDAATKNLEAHLSKPQPIAQGEADVEVMTRRFLGWTLPEDFCPDCGISFTPLKNPQWTQKIWPVGTNLLTYEQAKDMFRYVLATAPDAGSV